MYNFFDDLPGIDDEIGENEKLEIKFEQYQKHIVPMKPSKHDFNNYLNNLESDKVKQKLKLNFAEKPVKPNYFAELPMVKESEFEKIRNIQKILFQLVKK